MRRKRSRSSLFDWRLKQAFVKLALLALALGTVSQAHALGISFTYPTVTDPTIICELGCAPADTLVNFTIDTPGSVVIDVYKVANFGDVGTKVSSRIYNYTSAGPQSELWDALWLMNEEYGRINGTYQFEITLSTTSGSTAVRVGSLVTLNSVDIHNVTVTPSLDTARQPTFPYRISYALAKEANTTVEIYNSSDTLVRTLIDSKLQFGESISTHTLSWDGLDSAGKTVPIGIYSAVLNATDPAVTGSYAIQRTKTFAVTSLAGSASDPQKTFEDNVFVYPNPLRDSQGIFQYQAVREGANVTLKIYTVTGDLVLDKDFGSIPVGNVQNFTWDTTNASGNLVGRGLYFYVFREVDNQGTLQTTKKLAVIR